MHVIALIIGACLTDNILNEHTVYICTQLFKNSYWDTIYTGITLKFNGGTVCTDNNINIK